MRKGILGSLAVLAAGAGLSFGQSFGPPPGAAGMPSPPPGAYPGPGPVPHPGPSGPGMYSYTSPDGHPLIMPPGLEGMIPPGSMGAGAPGGVPGWDNHMDGGGGMGGMGGMGGKGKGLLGNMFGGFGPSTFYAGIDVLRWRPKAMESDIPLVTTSAPASGGVLGAPSTAAVCGPDDISFDNAHGIRAWVGYGLTDGLFCEVAGFWLSEEDRSFRFASNDIGSPLLAIPFFDADAGLTATSFIVSVPGFATGSIDIDAFTRARSIEANMVWATMGAGDGMPGGLALLAGVRWFQLEEGLTIRTASQGVGGSFTTVDSFETFNDFFGGQVGFRGDIGFGKWFIQTTGKIAVGYVRQRVDLGGESTASVGGITLVNPGGLFNEARDICGHTEERFACLPEGAINVGCQLGGHCRIHAGYTFLYINSVVRPTSTMSPVLNPTAIPLSGTFGASPANYIRRDVVRDTEFFLHGFNVGVQFSF